jgi:DNA-binding NtrC family response regulator
VTRNVALPGGSGTGLLGTDAGGQLVLRRVTVRVVSGPAAGASAVLDGGTLVLGASREADLRVADPAVSRFHVELQLLGEGVRVRDLGSTNGTYVGTARIEAMVLVPPAEIRVGKARVELLPADLPAPEAPADVEGFGPLVGQSPGMRRAFAVLARVAATDVAVALEGEPGTGKTAAAHALHAHSARSARPLVPLDLATATSAAEVNAAFSAAEGGTILLERVDEARVAVAEAVVAALDARERGAIDVRPIATARSDLREAVERGRLRRELWFHLAAVRVTLPPLRERLEDIPLLQRALSAELGRPGAALPAAERARLAERGYEGNVRALRAALEGAIAIGALEGGAVGRPSHPPPVAGTGPGAPGSLPPPVPERPFVAPLTPGIAAVGYREAKERVLDEFERAYVAELLERHGGNLSRAAESAGLDRNHLARLARKHGLR